MTEAPDTIDLSPDWEALAEYFDAKAQDARVDGNNLAHTIWTDLAEKAEDADLTKQQVYHWAEVDTIDEVDERYLEGYDGEL